MYDAFVTYTHRDKVPALAVQSGLHKFAKPWYALAASRVFRDESELRAGLPLWREIEAALANSRYLILIASAHASRSAGVTREIDYWLSHRSTDTVIIVCVSGLLRWDGARQCFSSDTDCLPTNLLTALRTEPLWCDLRWATAPEQMTLGNLQFRDLICRVAARLRGVSPAQLDGEDIRQHRRTRRTAGAAALVLLASFGLLAIQSMRARREHAVASSREIAAEAMGALAFDPELGLRLAIDAATVSPTTEATNALRHGIARLALRWRQGGDAGQGFAAYLKPSGDSIVIARGDTIQVHGIGGEPTRAETKVPGLRFTRLSPNGRYVLAVGLRTISLLDAGDLSVVASIAPLAQSISDVDWHPDSRWVVFSTEDGQITRWSLDTGVAEPIFHVPSPGALRFAHSGRTVAITSDRHVEVWDIESRERVSAAPENPDGYRSVLFSPDDERVIGYGALDNKSIGIWEAKTGRLVGGMRHRDSALVFGLSPDGKTAVSGDESSADVLVWDTGTGNRRFELRGHGSRVLVARFSTDGRFIATGARDRNIVLWDVLTGQQSLQLTGHRDAVRSIEFSTNGRRILSTSADGEVRVWDLASEPILRVQAGPTGDRINYDDRNIVRVGFAQKGRYAIAVGAGYAAVLNAATGALMNRAAGNFSFSDRREAWGSYSRTDYTKASPATEGGIWVVAENGELIIARIAMPTAARPIVAVTTETVLASHGGAVELWAKGKAEPIWTVNVGKWVHWAGFDRETGTLLVESDSRTLVVDGASGSIRDELKRTGAFEKQLSGDANRLRTVADVVLWRPSAKAPFRPFLQSSPWGSTAVDSSDRLCAIGRADGSIVLLDLAAGQAVGEVSGHHQRIEDIAFSADGTFLAAVAASGVSMVWDVRSRSRIMELRGHRADATSVAFSPDTRSIATGGLGGEVLIYEAEYTEPLASLISLARHRATLVTPATRASR